MSERELANIIARRLVFTTTISDGVSCGELRRLIFDIALDVQSEWIKAWEAKEREEIR